MLVLFLIIFQMLVMNIYCVYDKSFSFDIVSYFFFLNRYYYELENN